jgi:hypothetical protein
MSASGYAAWQTLFPKEEALYTEIRSNPFRLLVVATEGIELRIPVKKTKAKDRTLLLRYDRLDALWESRAKVSQKDLNTTVNKVWKKRGLGTDYTNESQYWALVCTRRRRERRGLRDEEANRVVYSPHGDDQRQVVERQIRERRGQQKFRDALLDRHGNRCLVTTCTVLAVIEAAHIHPYRGENDNHPDNGLLLRADIHTLFDLNLLGIEPDHFQVELELGYAPANPPSQEALRERYKEFKRSFPETSSKLKE